LLRNAIMISSVFFQQMVATLGLSSISCSNLLYD